VTPIETPATNPWLSRYAKAVVVAAFWLIFTGGHTTTSGAGMAFPDWPLSNGSLNPEGWLTDFFMLLEHGHRLTAGVVATMVAVLFGWVCAKRATLPRAAFWLALWALVGVLSQAVLGGLRVILDPQGIAATTSSIAMTFRVLHGCFAQIELGIVVALAAVLSPVWPRLAAQPDFRKIARLAWITVAVVFLQLVAGASMRHLGAGLAIPTFPLTPDGTVMPRIHNAYIDLNFTHTRFGALVVTAFILWLAARAFRFGAGEARLTRPAILLLALLAVQVTLGILVIWHLRPPMITTLHVVNGAAVLATAVLLAVRASHGAAKFERQEVASVAHLTEATA
jgi:heme a synthase